MNGPVWLAVVALASLAVVGFLLLMGKLLKFLRGVRDRRMIRPAPESYLRAAVDGAGEGPDDPERLPDGSDGSVVPLVETRPGKVLAHALKRDELSPGCQLGFILGMAAFWNVIVGSFLFQLWQQWNAAAAAHWLAALILAPFVVIGLRLILAAVAALVRWIIDRSAGRVAVEISVHPLRPGVTAQVYVAQTGPAPLVGLIVELVCIEEVTDTAGMREALVRETVASYPIGDPATNDGPALPFSATVTVPTGVMHSFTAPNNAISWAIRVRGRVHGQIPYCEDFSLTMAPE